MKSFFVIAFGILVLACEEESSGTTMNINDYDPKCFKECKEIIANYDECIEEQTEFLNFEAAKNGAYVCNEPDALVAVMRESCIGEAIWFYGILRNDAMLDYVSGYISAHPYIEGTDECETMMEDGTCLIYKVIEHPENCDAFVHDMEFAEDIINGAVKLCADSLC